MIVFSFYQQMKRKWTEKESAGGRKAKHSIKTLNCTLLSWPYKEYNYLSSPSIGATGVQRHRCQRTPWMSVCNMTMAGFASVGGVGCIIPIQYMVKTRWWSQSRSLSHTSNMFSPGYLLFLHFSLYYFLIFYFVFPFTL